MANERKKDFGCRVTIESIDTNVTPHVVYSSISEFCGEGQSEESLAFIICQLTYDRPISYIFRLLTVLAENCELGDNGKDKDMAKKCIKLITERFLC